jgi:hypothetical protein
VRWRPRAIASACTQGAQSVHHIPTWMHHNYVSAPLANRVQLLYGVVKYSKRFCSECPSVLVFSLVRVKLCQLQARNTGIAIVLGAALPPLTRPSIIDHRPQLTGSSSPFRRVPPEQMVFDIASLQRRMDCSGTSTLA